MRAGSKATEENSKNNNMQASRTTETIAKNRFTRTERQKRASKKACEAKATESSADKTRMADRDRRQSPSV